MKKRYARAADVLEISSRMHNFHVFLMPDAYWRFIVNFPGHCCGQRNEILFRRNNKARGLYTVNPQERVEPNRISMRSWSVLSSR